MYWNLACQLTAAAYTSCPLNAHPLVHLIHTPNPLFSTSDGLHNCGDSCQDPAGSSDALVSVVEPRQDMWPAEVPTVAQTDRGGNKHLAETLFQH